MIYASNAAKTLLEQSSGLTVNIGCTLEYNLNSLVDGITLTGATISKTDTAGNIYQPFKKLFPIDSVIKGFRPIGAGVKYAIAGDVLSGSYKNPKSTTYPIEYRTYYPGAESVYKYYISALSTGLDVTASYPKTILTNKIVIRFELAHSTPPTWTVYTGSTQIASGTNAEIKTFVTGSNKNYDAGTVTLYYNGTSWTTSEPAMPVAPVSITSLRLTTGAVSGKYIGLIELSPRWIVDITDSISSLSIAKESSTSADDILPVGKVSANSLSLDLISYEDSRKIISFDKTFTFDSTKIYLYKQVEIKPYYKIYHPAGTLTDSKGLYEKINQGVFYLDNWATSEFGEIGLTALDGAKVLQETIAPSILCEGFSSPAIIRRLLDSVGFTNYNINVKSTDNSILTPRYWWTEDSKTVWSAIQDLCRDSQMTAVFDENNILQFYTRDFLFDNSRTVDATFRYAASGSNLPNIVSFNKSDLSSANQVKVYWNSVTTSQFSGNSQPLWKSGNSFMGALSLEENLLTTATTGQYMSLLAVVANEASKQIVLNEYQGYLVIDSEIIEYDAIQYAYIDVNGTRQTVDITTGSDALKYLGLSQTGSTYGPSGKYRIKTRGAFNTPVANHYATALDILNSWSTYEVTLA